MNETIRTPRLLIRAWRPQDAPRLKEAIDSSLPELREWVPWALHEPSPVDVLAARLGRMRASFLEGRDWPVGLFDPADTHVLGGAGLHGRGGTDHLEIGYWIRTDATGRGYATEAARALCEAAFAEHGVGRVEIHCDVRNVRSAAVARRLGFTLARTVREAAAGSFPQGSERDMQVWVLTRGAFERRRRAARQLRT